MAKLAIGTLADFASDSIQVGINEILPEKNKVLLYPNPIENDHFSVDHITGKNIIVRITDVNGKNLFEKEIIPENEIINIQLPQQLSSGLYNLMLMEDDVISYKRFLKL